ncbi:helix-turn-helix domain-containing protein [Dyella psychrodurans]|nr:helix-turn-helix domain-containing protein [Dyella psychrodurans]
MNATNNLLDKYAEICAVSFDKDIAAKLRVSKQAVSNWRKGHAHPDAESVERMCEATNESVAHWLPLIEADRARTPEARKVWLRLAQAAASIALIIMATKHGHGAESAQALLLSPVYIMRNLRRFEEIQCRTCKPFQ